MATLKRGKKRNADILSVRDFKDGVNGAVGELYPLLGFDGEQRVSKSYGTPLWLLDMIDLESGEAKKYWADGGIRGALKMGNIKPGEKICLVHTGETEMELDDGKKGRVQTYDIFTLE